MVIRCYCGAETHTEHGQPNPVCRAFLVAQARIPHQTSCVDHIQFVNQLPRVFQGCVKHEAAEADEEVAVVGDFEDVIVAVPTAALDTLPGTVPEHQIGESVDYFGRVVCCVVVLDNCVSCAGLAGEEEGLLTGSWGKRDVPLHTIAGWM